MNTLLMYVLLVAGYFVLNTVFLSYMDGRLQKEQIYSARRTILVTSFICPPLVVAGWILAKLLYAAWAVYQRVLDKAWSLGYR